MSFPSHEIAQEIAWLAAAAGGLVAAFKGLHEIRTSTEQRKHELRWRRAKAAKELIGEIHASLLADNAITMLDWESGRHTYKDKKGSSHTIAFSQIVPALGCEQCETLSDAEQFIRDCFDWLFYYVNQVEHHIRTGYIDFIDVEDIFRPYARKFRANAKVVITFTAYREYPLVVPFFERYALTLPSFEHQSLSNNSSGI